MTDRPPSAPSGAPLSLAHLDLKLRYVPLSTLRALGRKARSHPKDQIRRIADSIQTFGFTVPIIVDEADHIIAGTARVEAARHIGLDQVPVVALSHLTPAAKRAFVLAENQLATLAGWDKDVLRIELQELSALDLDFSIELTGFVEAEIDAILFDGTATGRGDKHPALPECATSQVGELWLLGEHRLYCGDSTDPASLAALLGDEQARCVFTDIPYNVGIANHVAVAGNRREFVMASGEMSDDEFLDFMTRSFEQIAARLAPGGLAYFCIDWRSMDKVQTAAATTDLELLNLIVWDRVNPSMGSFYRSQHELIFLFRKPGAAHLNRVQLGSHGRNRANLWRYEGVTGFGSAKARARELHPTVKNLAMVRDAILDCTARGDLVLDLFSGSGTTLVAAHEAGRRGAAIDLDPLYVDTAILRWQDFAGREARLASTGQAFREVRAARSAPHTAPTSSATPPPARVRVRAAA